MPTAETRLIGTAGGMVPFEGPIDWERHNRGITQSFLIRIEPKLDEDSKVILDATGKPAEHSMECVRIQVAGDVFTEAVQPVDDVIKERFAAQYLAWKSGDESVAGTRLTDWNQPEMTARLIRDLEDLHVHSVEDLAAISDAHINKIVDGRMWRAKAIAWLQAHPNPKEEGEIAKLKAQNEALMKRLEALEKSKAGPSKAMKEKMRRLRERKAVKRIVINEAPAADVG